LWSIKMHYNMDWFCEWKTNSGWARLGFQARPSERG
jgi:hypothetical protein